MTLTPWQQLKSQLQSNISVVPPEKLKVEHPQQTLLSVLTWRRCNDVQACANRGINPEDLPYGRKDAVSFWNIKNSLKALKTFPSLILYCPSHPSIHHWCHWGEVVAQIQKALCGLASFPDTLDNLSVRKAPTWGLFSTWKLYIGQRRNIELIRSVTDAWATKSWWRWVPPLWSAKPRA